MSKDYFIDTSTQQ